MATITAPAPTARLAAPRAGAVLTGLLTLFFLFDAGTKLLQVPDVVAATEQMGFPAVTVPVIGATLLACLVLYVVPRTSLLGAVLLTGYLGGAVCAQLRIGAPIFSTLLFPVYVGVVVWAALYLRSPQVRGIVAGMLGR